MINYGGHFDFDKKEKRILELEKEMTSSHFWDDKKKSETCLEELNQLKSSYQELISIKKKIEDNIETLYLLEKEFDEELLEVIEKETDIVEKHMEKIKYLLLLNHTNDSKNAVLEIHAGAGGTESCDWASMLNRMYVRWCEKKNYKMELLAETPGEETGYKTISYLIKGPYAYGYLKNEKGVHRLIRLSPFDSGNRRHTSFASVEVTPMMDKDIDIEIKDSDLRIDVYRSSGKGGQGVNTTDSAVRITHLPTKIVVTCQNERSQIQNKETAMKVLKNKLYKLELEKKEESLNQIKGAQMENGFGSQIRTYVLHPYTMIKDHRTNIESSNAEKILDGEIDLFINEMLKRG